MATRSANMSHNYSHRYEYGNESDMDYDSDLDLDDGLHDVDLENLHTGGMSLHRNAPTQTVPLSQGSRPKRSNQRISTPMSMTSMPPIDHIHPESELCGMAKKVKNALLMLPALFIFCVILFVSYCTLFLAVPWRYKQEVGKWSLPILTVLAASLFFTVNFLCIWSFLKCVFTSSHVSKNPPKRRKTDINEESTRRCHKCNQFKPQRAHHCSICQECTLKMDHHCPWVSNCVGYYNYKYFVLFIWYATLGCHLSSIICMSQLYGVLTGRTHASAGYSGGQHGWMMVNSLLTLAFGITLTCFSFFHGSLVARGLTTIEVGADNPYDLGFKGNWMAIFGKDWKYMFIPIHTMSGDGYEFSDNNPLFGMVESDDESDEEEDEMQPL